MGSELSISSYKNETSLLSKREALLLSNETNYRIDELHQLHYRFYRDIISISPELNNETEQGIEFPLFCCSLAFIGVTSPILQEMFFTIFDKDHDGVITFEDFAKALSIMSRGTPEEKIDLAFDMFFCVNSYPNPMTIKSFTIQRKGMHTVLQALESTFGELTVCQEHSYYQEMKEFSAEDIINNLFASKEEVTREEFAAYAMECPAIKKGLALF